jgi:hypothetical protein
MATGARGRVGRRPQTGDDEMEWKPSGSLDSGFAFIGSWDWSKRYGEHIYTAELESYVAVGQPDPVAGGMPAQQTLYQLRVRAGGRQWIVRRRYAKFAAPSLLNITAGHMDSSFCGCSRICAQRWLRCCCCCRHAGDAKVQ